MAGLVVGAVTIFVWKYVVRPMGGAFDIYELLPAFVLALAVNIVVSLATAPPEKDVVEGFEEYERTLHA